MSVYANGLEIAGKAKGGKSTACSPDPCFSPPSPTAGWIVIPYANTTKAKDTKNASKTVFIEGKPVMLKDKSYFKTSTGNEGAAGPKGVSTGVKKGKAFFTSWSMDIKVEGYNVCRHTDGITHNHGSTGNTVPWSYKDGKNPPPKDCFDACKRMQEVCGNFKKDECVSCFAKAQCGDKTSQERLREEKNKRANSRKGRLRKKIIGTLDNKLDKLMNWKQMNCSMALIINECTFNNPEKIKELQEKFSQRKQDFSELQEQFVAKISEFKDSLPNSAVEIIGAIGEAALGKSVLDFAAKKVPFLGQAKSAYDVGGVLWDVYDLGSQVRSWQDEITVLGDKMSKQFEENIKDLKELKEGELTKNTFLEKQRRDAETNKCIKARKCKLVTYSQSNNPNIAGDTGCCPGQTGHHLIPNSMFQVKNEATEKKETNIKECAAKYSYSKAPVVCAEGTNQHSCSHGDAHTETASMFQKTFEDRGGDIDLDSAIKDAAEAHNKAFKNPGCGRGCIESQLREHYKEKCGCKTDDCLKNIIVNPVDGKGNDLVVE
jgi:hypothetical protein